MRHILSRLKKKPSLSPQPKITPEPDQLVHHLCSAYHLCESMGLISKELLELITLAKTDTWPKAAPPERRQATDRRVASRRS